MMSPAATWQCASPDKSRRRGLLCCVLLLASGIAGAGYRDDVGFTQLAGELGAGLPDGAGVPVAQVEGGSYLDHDNNPATPDLLVYLPDPGYPQFSGKSIIDRSNQFSGYYSGHATLTVGQPFYGNASSIAPGITAISAWYALDWLQGGYLHYGGGKPAYVADRLANSSWVGSFGNAADSELLRRLDWVIATDEFIQVVGSNNGTGTNFNLLSGSWNAIVAGRTDGLHTTGTSDMDSDYVSGRARPEIVAPFTTTSGATAGVSSAVALLIAAGHANSALSSGATTNRNGDTIRNAERSEVIKAVLMAGALRTTANGAGADIIDYRALPANRTDNGLDRRFGAGQLNIYNSYMIQAGAEQDSDEDDGAGTGLIDARGWDFDPSFGGGGGSNATASYRFTATGGLLTATLAWNIEIEAGPGQLFGGSAAAHDLNLELYDETAAPQLVAASTSSVDNTETISQEMQPGHTYRLLVSAAATLQWDYALAWQVAPDADGDGVPDAQDDFPADPSEFVDTDGDGIGNNADSDDDGDGFSDAVETVLGHDPLDAGDAPLWGDLDHNGLVDHLDVLLAGRAVAGEMTPSVEQLAVGRVAPLVGGVPSASPGDTIRPQDLALIERRVLGLVYF